MIRTAAICALHNLDRSCKRVERNRRHAGAIEVARPSFLHPTAPSKCGLSGRGVRAAPTWMWPAPWLPGPARPPEPPRWRCGRARPVSAAGAAACPTPRRFESSAAQHRKRRGGGGWGGRVSRVGGTSTERFWTQSWAAALLCLPIGRDFLLR